MLSAAMALGSLRLGQFTMLELERERADGAWHIASTTSHQQLPLTDDDDDGDL